MDLFLPRPDPPSGVASPDTAPWWIRPGELTKELSALDDAGGRELTFRFGGGHLRLASSDPQIAERFVDLYGECASAPTAMDPATTIGCRIRAARGRPVALVSFEDPEPLNATGLYQLLFEDWGYRMTGSDEPGWWRMAFGLEPDLPHAAGSARHILFDSAHRWQPLAGQMIVNRVLMLQRRSIFFHAAAVSIGGAGAVLAGGRGQGKTTLSLALASRGHGFLGDEVAAVDTRTWTLLPFRRSTSIRPGPAGWDVRARLAARSFPEEMHPDGTRRTRVRVGEIFPDAPGDEAPLRALFVLLAREPRPRVERIAPRREHLVRLPLLRCTMWEMPIARRFLALTRTLASVALFHLHPGDPDETSELIERTMEGL